MKKIGLLFIALTMCMFVASAANAVTFSTALGAQLSITITVPGADTPMLFNPSPKVNMTGASQATGFATNAVHASAIGTEGAKAYGMAADSNQVFFTSAAATNYTLPAQTTGTSTAGTINGWTAMQ